jgi:hypothetical protein
MKFEVDSHLSKKETFLDDDSDYLLHLPLISKFNKRVATLFISFYLFGNLLLCFWACSFCTNLLRGLIFVCQFGHALMHVGTLLVYFLRLIMNKIFHLKFKKRKNIIQLSFSQSISFFYRSIQRIYMNNK